MITRYWQKLAILAGERIRYWQGSRSDTGRGFDTGRIPRPILAGMAALLFLALACSTPGWVSTPTQAPTARPISTETSSPEGSQKPQDRREAPIPSPVSLRATVSASRSLNVREGPSRKSPGISVLYHGESVAYTGTCTPSGWVEIVFQGSRAWVDGRYIEGEICREAK